MVLDESDQDIERLVTHLERKIIELKKKNPTHELLKLSTVLFTTDIANWYENYKFNNNLTSKDRETQLKNDILDLINILNKL